MRVGGRASWSEKRLHQSHTAPILPVSQIFFFFGEGPRPDPFGSAPALVGYWGSDVSDGDVCFADVGRAVGPDGGTVGAELRVGARAGGRRHAPGVYTAG